MKEEYTKRIIDLTDQYLNGGITSANLDVLKQEMEKEPFLKKVIEQQVQARANIRVVGEQQLRTRLMNRFEVIPVEKQSSNLWIKILAAVLLIAILSVVYFLYQNT